MIQSTEEFDSIILAYIDEKIKSEWGIQSLTPEDVLSRIKEGTWDMDCPSLSSFSRIMIPKECRMCSDGDMWGGECMYFSDEELEEFGLNYENMGACEICWTVSYLLTRKKIDELFLFWRLKDE